MAHKHSDCQRAMEKTVPQFHVGSSYTNRKGTYKVLSISGKLMTVRYEGGYSDEVLNVDTQRKIIFAIFDDTAVFVSAVYQDKEGHFKDFWGRTGSDRTALAEGN